MCMVGGQCGFGGGIGSEANDLEDHTEGIADDEIPLGTGANVLVYRQLPDCDGAGEALQYNPTTNIVSCLTGLGAGGTVDDIEGDTGGPTAGANIEILGGTNGIDTFCSGSQCFLELDFNEIGIIPVTQGGTGAATFAVGGIMQGNGTGALTPSAVLANGQLLIGDGTTFPTVGTITATADETTVTNGAGTITIGLADPLIVGKGGTGAASFTPGGIMLGNSTSALTQLAVQTDGQIPIGDGSGAPTLATLTGGRGISNTVGPGSSTLAAEAELYTEDVCVVLRVDGGIALTDDVDSIFRTSLPIEVTGVWCETDTGTATANIQRDDGAPVDIATADLVCDTDGEDACEAGCTEQIAGAEDNLTAGQKIDLQIVSVSGAERLSVCFTYTKDD